MPPAGLRAIFWAGHQCPLPHLFCLCFQAASLFHFPFWLVNSSNSGTPQMSPILMLGFLTCSPFTTTIIIHSLLLRPTSWTDPSAVSVALDCKGSFTTWSDLQNLSFLLGSRLPTYWQKLHFCISIIVFSSLCNPFLKWSDLWLISVLSFPTSMLNLIIPR